VRGGESRVFAAARFQGGWENAFRQNADLASLCTSDELLTMIVGGLLCTTHIVSPVTDNLTYSTLSNLITTLIKVYFQLRLQPQLHRRPLIEFHAHCLPLPNYLPHN
jgi:hypothetical protein